MITCVRIRSVTISGFGFGVLSTPLNEEHSAWRKPASFKARVNTTIYRIGISVEQRWLSGYIVVNSGGWLRSRWDEVTNDSTHR